MAVTFKQIITTYYPINSGKYNKGINYMGINKFNKTRPNFQNTARLILNQVVLKLYNIVQ